jgi:murein DD-endopeptidase MepM/ murein hydrolase activator NlpD
MYSTGQSQGAGWGFNLNADADYVASLLALDDDKAAVACVALGGHATALVLYENGDQAWTSGLPTQLYNKLNGRQKSLPPPEYLSMGSEDRWYVRFEDGKSQWVGCKFMTAELQSTDVVPWTVAFGKSSGSFFIVFEDGSFSYQNIPNALEEFIDNLEESHPKLEQVSLGPKGEWFVETDTGERSWGSLSPKCRKHIEDYEKFDNVFVKTIVFGADDQYLFEWECVEKAGSEGFQKALFQSPKVLVPHHISRLMQLRMPPSQTLQEENKKRQQEENKKRQQEENKKRQQEENKKRQQEENKKRQQEENKKRQQEENKKRQQEENKKRQQEENKKRQQEENKKQQQEENKKRHSDSDGKLRKLADEITPSKYTAKRGHGIMNMFVRAIQEELSIITIHKGGSIGKKTAIWLKIDFDILVFVDEQEIPPDKCPSFVNRIQAVLLARFPLEQMECTDDRFTWYISLVFPQRRLLLSIADQRLQNSLLMQIARDSIDWRRSDSLI